MSPQERTDMIATEGMRASRAPGAGRRDNTEALLAIMEQEQDLVPMSEVTIVFKDAEGHMGSLVCRKASSDITVTSLMEEGCKILKRADNIPDKSDRMKRFWAVFSRTQIVNNFDVDRFYIITLHGEAIIDALSMGFEELVEEELIKYYQYGRCSQSYNGFTVTTFTQDNLKVEVPQIAEKRSVGIISKLSGHGGD